MKFVQTFARSSSFTETCVRRALTLSATNEIYYWFSSNEAWDLAPGAIKGLSKLTDAGIKLAVLSNSDERTPTILKSLDLNRFFTVSLWAMHAVDKSFRLFSQLCLSLSSSLGAVIT